MLQVRWPSCLAASFFFQAANSRAKRLRLLGGKEYLQTDSSQQSSAHPASISTNSFAFGCSQVVDVEDLRSFADVSIR